MVAGMSRSVRVANDNRQFARNRRGSVLIEFAMIAMVTTLLLSATITFGLMMFQANIAQRLVADEGALAIARMPLSINATSLGMSLTPPEADTMPISQSDPNFKTQIYDEKYLYVTQDDLNGTDWTDFVTTLPLINRLLTSVMFVDYSMDPTGVYRFPAHVVENSDGQLTVLVPIVNYQTSTITWAKPVEEVLIPDGGGSFLSQFNATPPATPPPNFVPSVVAIRVNIPSQSASMSGFAPPAPSAASTNDPVPADDGSLSDSGLGSYSLVVGANQYKDQPDNVSDGSNVYGGKYGLGQQLSYSTWVGPLGVRPFRKVVSAQAVYRREAFQ